MSDERVLIIPCSGVGKAFGTVGREAMYTVVEDLRPGVTDTVCLSLLTLGDEAAQDRVRQQPTITIDGCPKLCARVNVEAAGGHPAASFRVVDTYRRHRELRSQAIAMPDAAGQHLAQVLAEEVVAEVDRLRGEEV
ncbi:MAG: putative zinc-binding protein [Chloroflexi bacterium]|nr:putative zinc-binding protein [Chloroflexota bacterium]MBU1751434.1 putative zinc-binding protein [Chloroflexota bacterium]MBU1880229.1 putative zinc-binding protein [Chloroflexota bacterium]